MSQKIDLNEYAVLSCERINYLVNSFCKGSQQEFCARTGINRSSVSQFMSGRLAPTNFMAVKIADAFQINPAWVMGFSSNMIEDPKTVSDKEHNIQINVQADDAYYDRIRTMQYLATAPANEVKFLSVVLDEFMKAKVNETN